MTAAALTDEARADLPRAFKGNICRCTGYGSIADALAGRPRVGDASAVSATGAPSPVGSGLPAPACPDVVTGRAAFTLDTSVPGLLHMKLVRSPHAHARIRSVNARAALALPGVAAVFSYADSPPGRYSTARHHNPGDDACDTALFDQTVRFAGQRVAAVVADSAHTAARACDLVRVDYDVLPAVADPDLAMAPGAPVLHPGLPLAARRAVTRDGTLRRKFTAEPGISLPVSRRRTPRTSRRSGSSGSSTCTWRRTPPSGGWTKGGWCCGPARRRRS